MYSSYAWMYCTMCKSLKDNNMVLDSDIIVITLKLNICPRLSFSTVSTCFSIILKRVSYQISTLLIKFERDKHEE